MVVVNRYCTQCGGYHENTSAGCPYYQNDDKYDTVKLESTLCPMCRKFHPPHEMCNFYTSEHTYVVSVPSKQPFKCPVCNGTGLVSRPQEIAGDIDSWTSNSTNPYPCKACAGTGIVWGPND